MNEKTATRPRIVTVADGADLGQKAAAQFVDLAAESITRHGEFRVALSGGNTPRALYSALISDTVRNQVQWESVQIFFSDERFVPPDSEQSNFHTAREAFLSRVPIPECQVHRVATVDTEPAHAAALYEEAIRRVFHASTRRVPAFDLILLGMGPDGHTASLFPDTRALDELSRLVAPNYVGKLKSWRITFTYPLLNAARVVTFLVQGEDKKAPLAALLAGNSGLPAAGIRPRNGRTVWFVDRSALPESLA